MADDGKCEHDGCSCPVADDSSYCSQQCENADDSDMVEISCGCGHASCGTAV
jgi:hypothetical protein